MLNKSKNGLKEKQPKQGENMENQTTVLDPATLEILSKIDAFYSSSFNHLMWFLTISFVVIGVLVPFIINYLQKRQFKNLIEQSHIEHAAAIKISEQKILEDYKRELESYYENIKTNIGKTVSTIDNNIRQVQGFAQAATVFIEGKLFFIDGEYYQCVCSYLTSYVITYEYGMFDDKQHIEQLFATNMHNLVKVLENLEVEGVTIHENKEIRRLFNSLNSTIRKRNEEFNSSFIDTKLNQLDEVLLDLEKKVLSKTDND